MVPQRSRSVAPTASSPRECGHRARSCCHVANQTEAAETVQEAEEQPETEQSPIESELMLLELSEQSTPEQTEEQVAQTPSPSSSGNDDTESEGTESEEAEAQSVPTSSIEVGFVPVVYPRERTISLVVGKPVFVAISGAHFGENIHVRLFSSLFHPSGVSEGVVVAQRGSQVQVRLPQVSSCTLCRGTGRQPVDVIGSESPPARSVCSSCLDGNPCPVYAIISNQYGMSNPKSVCLIRGYASRPPSSPSSPSPTVRLRRKPLSIINRKSSHVLPPDPFLLPSHSSLSSSSSPSSSPSCGMHMSGDQEVVSSRTQLQPLTPTALARKKVRAFSEAPILTSQPSFVGKRLLDFDMLSRDTSISVVAGTHSPQLIESSIRSASDFIQSLPDECYDVIKINARGRRQKRALRLDPNGVYNCKGGRATSFHRYMAIKFVDLVDVDRLVLGYHDYHDTFYSSPVAEHIVRDIQRRVSIMHTIEKSRFASDLSVKYQQAWERQKLSRASDASDSWQKPEEEETPNERPSKLSLLTGDTLEQRIQMTVEKVVLDSRSDEGKARTKFLKSFATIEKSPTQALQSIRTFMDQLRSHIINHHGESLRVLYKHHGTDKAALEEMDARISTLVEAVIERAVVMPLRERIHCLLGKIHDTDEVVFRDKVQQLTNHHQSFFGIPASQRSSTNWVEAVWELSSLQHQLLPSAMARTLVACAKNIYESFALEQKRRLQSSGKITYLSGDDFLPICIFVVVQSTRFTPWVSDYLQGLCDPSALVGEQGYYLTVFQAALEYIKHVNAQQEVSVSG